MSGHRARPSALRSIRKDTSGVGAIEFALVVPILLALLLGGSELGVALTIDRKVKAAAGAAVDLASQSTQLESSDFPKLMGIARGSLAPYSIAPLAMRLTQIRITGDGQGTVDWSCGSKGYGKLAKGTPVTVPPAFAGIAKSIISQILSQNGKPLTPADLKANAIYIVRGEAKYDFEPVTGQVFGETISLSGVTYVQPRYSDSVESNSQGCNTFTLQ